MEIGKVPNNVLKDIILKKLRHNRDEVLIRPGIGEDCCAIDFGENACVLSSDPITGAVNEIGRLAVHISCNDVASCGVEPLGLLVTILAPAGSTEKDLDTIMTQIADTAYSMDVEILGGHTEITNAVNRFVIVSTAVGKALKDKLIKSCGAKNGDSIIMTKYAGLEGTAIIAHDHEQELKTIFGAEFVDEAKQLIENISVLKEGKISGRFGVNSMHDVTEGGILGAVWEIAKASSVGMEIFKEQIPILQTTRRLCEYYNIDPLKLISSGCMLITTADGKGLVDELSVHGVKATVIGSVIEGTDIKLHGENGIETVEQPETDELYKVI